jgi:Tfp pilus assembly protein PilN
VKPLHLNLAAKPYRDYRPITAVLAAGWLVFLSLAYVNVVTYLDYKRATKQTSAAIERLDAQTEQEHRRAEDATARLARIDQKTLAIRTQYVNSQLAQRAFSWSELLDRLEHVLPNDVRIEGVAPQFDKTGLIHLQLQCHGKSNESMVKTIDAFNADPHFANPFPKQEEVTERESLFAVDVDYRPAIARAVE